jgi:hypothetical protein
MKYETIKVLQETKSRFDQAQRELAAKLKREVTQDELVSTLLKRAAVDWSVVRRRIFRELKAHDSPHSPESCTFCRVAKGVAALEKRAGV